MKFLRRYPIVLGAINEEAASSYTGKKNYGGKETSNGSSAGGRIRSYTSNSAKSNWNFKSEIPQVAVKKF